MGNVPIRIDVAASRRVASADQMVSLIASVFKRLSGVNSKVTLRWECAVRCAKTYIESRWRKQRWADPMRRSEFRSPTKKERSCRCSMWEKLTPVTYRWAGHLDGIQDDDEDDDEKHAYKRDANCDWKWMMEAAVGDDTVAPSGRFCSVLCHKRLKHRRHTDCKPWWPTRYPWEWNTETGWSKVVKRRGHHSDHTKMCPESGVQSRVHRLHPERGSLHRYSAVGNEPARTGEWCESRSRWSRRNHLNSIWPSRCHPDDTFDQPQLSCVDTAYQSIWQKLWSDYHHHHYHHDGWYCWPARLIRH